MTGLCQIDLCYFFIAFDLPQRPNEAYIFYGHISKVAVSLLGSTYSRPCEQSNSSEMMLTMAREDLQNDR